VIKFKDNTLGFQSLSPQIILAIMVIEGVCTKHGIEMVITSINDAKHALTSLHYSGNGIDFRSRDLPDKTKFLIDCKEALGNSPDFDLILESDHYHLEYQPKRR